MDDSQLIVPVQSEVSRKMGAKEVIVCRDQMTVKYDCFSSSEDQKKFRAKQVILCNIG